MKIGQTPKLSNANVSGKGHRPPKFSAPPVTSVNWGSVGQTFLTELAASKVGGISNLPISTDAINKIAFGCYSAKELPFILQGLGFASDYAVKKKDLLNQAIETFNSIHAMRNISSADKDKNLSTSPSASFVSASPNDTASAGVNNSANDMFRELASHSNSTHQRNGGNAETG